MATLVTFTINVIFESWKVWTVYPKHCARCTSHIHNHVTPSVISAVVGINEKLRPAATIIRRHQQVYHAAVELWVMNIVFI